MHVPRVIITDKLKRYGAAKQELLPGVEHCQSRYLKNQCENSHRPTRHPWNIAQGFNRLRPTIFVGVRANCPTLCSRRPRLSASAYRHEMRQRFEVGLRSWVQSGLPKRQDDRDSIPICLMRGLAHNKLTMPKYRVVLHRSCWLDKHYFVRI